MAAVSVSPRPSRAMVKASSGLIQRRRLHVPAPWWRRFDVLPFAVLLAGVNRPHALSAALSRKYGADR